MIAQIVYHNTAENGVWLRHVQREVGAEEHTLHTPSTSAEGIFISSARLLRLLNIPETTMNID